MMVSSDPATAKEQRQLAEITRAKREMQLLSGQWGLQDKLSAKILLYKYLEKMGEGRDKQKDRVCKALPWLEKFPSGKEIQIGQVTPKWFSNFQEFLEKDSGLSEQSAQSYSYAVRMALRKAVRENIIHEDPSADITGISIPEPDREFLEMNELIKLSKIDIGGTLGREVKRAFLFACYCALRISDIKSLVWHDIGHNTTGAQIIKRQIKTKKRVAVPLHESAWKLIDDGKEHPSEDPVFPLLSVSNTDTNKYLIRWAKRAGIHKHITWHAARRTCPTLLHELGVDIYTIQKICGHKRIETTLLYTKISDGKLRDAVNKLPTMEL